MKTQSSFQSALVAGLAATAAMTAFTFMAPLMDFEMNIPKMLAGTMGAPIIVGWAAHIMVGVVLAILYATAFLPGLNKEANLKSGALFGIVPWLLAQLMVMLMMKLMSGGSFASGVFSGSILVAIASLIGHLLYGAVLGSLYKPQSV